MKLKVLAVAAVLASVCGLAMIPSQASATVNCPEGSLRGPDAEVNSFAECNLPEPDDDDPGLINRVIDVINVIVGVVGVVAIAVVVIGAILFVVSTGDPAKITRAKNTILYGIVGLVIAFLAFALVNFVVNAIFAPKTATVQDPQTDSSSEE